MPSLSLPAKPLAALGLLSCLAVAACGQGGPYHGPISRQAASPAIAPNQLPAAEADWNRFPDAESNPVFLTAEQPVSTFSADVDTVSYSIVRRYLEEGRMPPGDAVRVEEMVNYFDYGYAAPAKRDRPFEPTVWVMPTPWNDGTKLLHIGIKGYEERPRAEAPLNLVFLVDTSGSMRGSDRLGLVKSSLKLLAKQMTAEDRIALVAYAGGAEVVLEPTAGDKRWTVETAIDSLSSGGGTAGAAGIEIAYRLAESAFDADAVNRVILATDGDFNLGIADPEALKDFIAEKRDSGIYLSVLGVGSGNYNDRIAQALAQNGNGNAAYIDSLQEARKVLVDEVRATLFPIADDVKFQVEFNPATVAEYRLIGYETRQLKREDFNNDAVDAGDIGAGHTVTALYEIVPVGSEARLTDPLRYGAAKTPALRQGGRAGEYAFLRIRYKLPGAERSQLIERPILIAESYDTLDRAPEDARFAAAVAAFGQHLRREPYLKEMDLDRMLDLALGTKGADSYGYRAEFTQLLRNAQTLEVAGLSQ